MPTFKIIIKKDGKFIVKKTFTSFPSRILAENWAKSIAEQSKTKHWIVISLAENKNQGTTEK